MEQLSGGDGLALENVSSRFLQDGDIDTFERGSRS